MRFSIKPDKGAEEFCGCGIDMVRIDPYGGEGPDEPSNSYRWVSEKIFSHFLGRVNTCTLKFPR